MNEHGRLNIQVFVDPDFQENSLLLWPRGHADAWIIDPGFTPHAQLLTAALEQRKLKAVAILLTHCHLDHIAGCPDLCAALPGVKLYAPRDEQHMLQDPRANLSGPFGFDVVAPPADVLLAPGDTLKLGALTFEVLDVSGHSPGGLAYLCREAGVVIVGDALFYGSVGRVDFPGSSGQRLLANIREHLLSLPDDTVVYSGHGPTTTIGAERTDNPFILGGMP